MAHPTWQSLHSLSIGCVTSVETCADKSGSLAPLGDWKGAIADGLADVLMVPLSATVNRWPCGAGQ